MHLLSSHLASPRPLSSDACVAKLGEIVEGKSIKDQPPSVVRRLVAEGISQLSKKAEGVKQARNKTGRDWFKPKKLILLLDADLNMEDIDPGARQLIEEGKIEGVRFGVMVMDPATGRIK